MDSHDYLKPELHVLKRKNKKTKNKSKVSFVFFCFHYTLPARRACLFQLQMEVFNIRTPNLCHFSRSPVPVIAVPDVFHINAKRPLISGRFSLLHKPQSRCRVLSDGKDKRAPTYTPWLNTGLTLIHSAVLGNDHDLCLSENVRIIY